MGAYEPGNDPRLDEAVAFHDSLEGFLSQDLSEAASLPASLKALKAVLEPAS
jgi:flagellum-specific ATP synthase